MPPDDVKKARRSAPAALSTPAAAQGEWLSLDGLVGELAAAGDPVVALSISGGGATGAYQAGVLRGLLAAIERAAERLGDRARQAMPRIIVGTSAGALNAFGLLLELLRSPDGDRCGSTGPEPYVSSLWRVIGSDGDGARFVTGRRAWLVAAATRWLRDRRVIRLAALLLLAVALLLTNPVLFGILLEAHPGTWLERLSELILENQVKVTIGAALVLVALALWIAVEFGRALFSNEALQDTLAAAAEAGLEGRTPSRRELLRRRRSYEREEAGMRVVQTWLGKARPPDFVLTATDLTAVSECLFALTSPQTFGRLADAGWLVGRIGPRSGAASPSAAGRCAAVAESQFLRCVVASTSIPGVFPSQRIRLNPMTAGAEVAHDFVDGGVLNNSPMNVAVDAGATHVISIELDPLHADPPLGMRPRGGEPGLVENVALTFQTLLALATSEDIYKTVALNRLIRDQALAQSPGLPREKLLAAKVQKKRVVEIYRIAPARRDVGTLEFNGHYPSAWGSPDPSLVEWLDQGASDVQKGSPFWRATFQAYP